MVEVLMILSKMLDRFQQNEARKFFKSGFTGFQYTSPFPKRGMSPNSGLKTVDGCGGKTHYGLGDRVQAYWIS